MNQDVLISVLMPVYNGEKYLNAAIESVLNQTYKNFELFIINDGSIDSTKLILDSYSDSRIKIIDNVTNKGLIYSLNKGIELSTGKYIARMDADDISLPERFDKQITFLESNLSISILATSLILIDQLDREIGYWDEDRHNVSETKIKETLPIINCIGHPTVMMRRNDVHEIGYKNVFKNNEDWGLWLHILSQNKRIAKLPEILLKYRIHPSSTTVSTNKLGVEKKIIQFKYKYLKYKLINFNLKNTDWVVLKSFVKESIKYALQKTIPSVYNRFIVLKNLNKISLLTQYFKVKKQLQKINETPDVLYFFSSYHTGGADRVHASILEAVNNKNSLVFITSKSDNDTFYNKFNEYATVIDVYELLKFGPTQKWLIKYLLKFCNSNAQIKLLGCNSFFYYQVIPQLPKHCFVIDLVHAFVHQFEDGPEKWSLQVVDRIDKRIVINEKTRKDFQDFYAKNNVPLNLLERINCIPNYVETEKDITKKSSSVFKVGYVGRGSEEKRVHLIAQVAQNLKNKNIEFHFVGNVWNSVPENLREYGVFHGDIFDDKKINELYKQFHVLIIASSREGFPMVIMEGMMHSVVPLCTNVGGISEHIHHNENGLLINSLNESDIVKELEANILKLNDNPAEYVRLSENAHQYALQHFNKSTFFSLYNNLLNK